MDSKEILTQFQPQKEFFIGIDSDGCVFDTMEIKQKECFCPNFIKYFDLQMVQKFARETWEFVNLYSIHRGCNRFHAVVHAIGLLEKREEFLKRNGTVPDLSELKEWLRLETKLGNPALESYVSKNNSMFMQRLLEWSKAVNHCIEEMVSGMPPFPYVRESLERIATQADLMVVSQTPYEALKREWDENNIGSFIRIIAGQEFGSKTEHLKYGAVGKYVPDKILMIGDAPGDLKAAQSNGVLFFPVNPGHEEASWELFFSEAADKFFRGTYKGPYEEELIARFKAFLPDIPPWISKFK